MKKLYYSIGTAIAAAFFLSLFLSAGVFSNINVRLIDNLYGGGTSLSNAVLIGIDDASLQEIGRWPWDRAVFAEFIDKYSNAEVIGIDVAFFESSEDDTILAEAISNSKNVILGVEYTKFIEEEDGIKGLELLTPVSELMENSAGLGYYNIPLDKDGVNRRINLDINGDYKSFAEAIYKKRFGRDFQFEEKELLINFVGIPGSFETVSFIDALNNDHDFSGKIVLIGATSPDFHDEYIVPISEGKAMPGIEIHANALQTMITRDFIYEQSHFSAIIIIFLISIVATLLLSFLRLRLATAILVGTFFAYIFFAIGYFSFKGILLNMVYPPIALAVAYLVNILVFYRREKTEKKQAVKAFSKYVSPEVVKEIMKDPSKLKLGGQKKEMTILFSDIRKFTTISEKLSAEQLVHLLNEYLTVMSDIVMERKGVVDKFIGDAIMALWGVPLKDEDQAKNACETAIEMMEKLGEVQKQWEKEGIPQFNIGIGINTGEAVAGNIGSHQRFDYTAIGDSVNLASRVEGLTKQYAVGILITESTKKKVEKDFVTRKIDLVAVKGKNEPVLIYELICRKTDDNYDNEQIECFEKGFDFYLEKKWGNAVKEFEKSLEIIKHDKAAQLFIERCNEFKKNPPPAKWNGAYVAKSK